MRIHLAKLAAIFVVATAWPALAGAQAPVQT